MKGFSRILFALLFCTTVIGCPRNGIAIQDKFQGLEKYLQDIRYGPHERNVMDIWLVTSDTPAPLVLFIHGGGFRGGDKTSLNKNQLQAYLQAGFSVAAINYRLTDSAPAPAAGSGAAPAVAPVVPAAPVVRAARAGSGPAGAWVAASSRPAASSDRR